MLYTEGVGLSNNQFLYIDIVVLIPLCVFQSLTGAYHKLTEQLPQESLFSAPVLVSVIGSAAIQFVFQYWVFVQTKERSGDSYIKCKPIESVIKDDPPCSSNTALYVFSCQQYLICCLAFSIAKPFRKPIYSNPLFFISISVLLIY